jgi:putative nucleotidyltransferase with HDIG domain
MWNDIQTWQKRVPLVLDWYLCSNGIGRSSTCRLTKRGVAKSCHREKRVLRRGMWNTRNSRGADVSEQRVRRGDLGGATRRLLTLAMTSRESTPVGLTLPSLAGWKLQYPTAGRDVSPRILSGGRKQGSNSQGGEDPLERYDAKGETLCRSIRDIRCDLKRALAGLAAAVGLVGVTGFTPMAAVGELCTPGISSRPRVAGFLSGIASRLLGWARNDVGTEMVNLDARDVALRSCVDGLRQHGDLYMHSQRVSELSVALVKMLNSDQRRLNVRLVRHAALLHDIGKLHFDSGVLQKPSELTQLEYDHIKSHCCRGAHQLTHLGLQELARIVRHHHEHYDGSGYPDGLAGQEIPLESRIIALADAVDAMENDRPYRARMARQEIKKELERCAGRQFDPMCVNAYFRLIEKGWCRQPQSTKSHMTMKDAGSSVMQGRSGLGNASEST